MFPRRRVRPLDPSTSEARTRIVCAAHVLLGEVQDHTRLSIDLIAARAGVARSIVGTQFGSLAGVFEALLDDLLVRSKLGRLETVFKLDDPREMLDGLIASFGDFWDSERLVVRRLRAIAAFDRELDYALRKRDEYRRETMRALSRRLGDKGVRPKSSQDELCDLLCALTGFEVFDGLAGPERPIVEAVPVLQRLGRVALSV